MTEILKESAAEHSSGTTSLLPVGSERSHWAFINAWKVSPQSDDRIPMFGAVANSTASPAARRSTARRKHQEMFKKWSQDRHE